jgi:hypothetical protein
VMAAGYRPAAITLPSRTATPGSSILERLAPELLERIAVHAGTLGFFGASPALFALLRTSRTLHTLLAPKNNAHVYARVFRAKFDAGAPARRLGPGWTHSRHLLAELHARYDMLSRLRCGVIIWDKLVVDLWTMSVL